MNAAKLLPLSFLGLLALAFAGTQGGGDPIVITARMHHLGNDPTPEWTEAPEEPEGGSLELPFQGRALTGEAVLFVRQRNVNDPWHLELNGTRFATLKRAEALGEEHYLVPAGLLVDGANTLALVGDVPTDDITFGEVRLHPGSLREVLDLREVVVRVREDPGGGPSPARVTVLDAEGRLAPLFYAERLHSAVREGVCYVDDGAARFEIAPGSYEVFATRGTEWSLGRAALVVDASEHEVELSLHREVDTTGWVACDTHVHTLTFSGHGDSSVEERMVTLAGEGVELAIATDHNHNTDYRPYQERMQLQRFFTPVVGNEVSTPIGHFNAFPLDPADEVPAHDLRDIVQIVEGIRAKGAEVVILNHPRWPDHETGPYGEAALDHFTGASGMVHPYDAVELINSQTEEEKPMLLFEDWFSLLNRGEDVRAVASSDSHTVGGVVGMGRTYVKSSTDDPAAIDVAEACRNMNEGRASLSMGIFVDVTVNGAGMGDLVAVAEPGEIEVRLRVRSASWIRPERARLYVNGILRGTNELPTTAGQATDLVQGFSVPTAAHDAWVVCVVTGAAVGGKYWPALNDYTLAATNPVFLDRDGDGAYASPRATAQRRLESDGSSQETLAALLASCDEAVGLQALELADVEYQRQARERLRGAASASAAASERVRAYLEGLGSR